MKKACADVSLEENIDLSNEDTVKTNLKCDMVVQTTVSICDSGLKACQKEKPATLSKDSSRLLETVEIAKLDKKKQIESFDEYLIRSNKNSSIKNPEKLPNDKALSLLKDVNKKRKAESNPDTFTALNSHREKNYSNHDYDSKKSKTSEYDKRSHASEKHLYNDKKQNFSRDREHNRDRHRHRDRSRESNRDRGRENDRDRNRYRERSSEKNNRSKRSSSRDKHYHNRNLTLFFIKLF